MEAAQSQGLAPSLYYWVYNMLAAYEMGEHHAAARRKRQIGDLRLADVYLKKVLESNTDVSGALLGAGEANSLSRTSTMQKSSRLL